MTPETEFWGGPSVLTHCDCPACMYTYGSEASLAFHLKMVHGFLDPSGVAYVQHFSDGKSALATIAPPPKPESRKDIPLCSGVLDYFPDALRVVAKVSKAGNDKHNPGEPLHWDRSKSNDHADCIARHLLDRGKIDPEDGLPHSAKLAWRALALLQEELDKGVEGGA